MNQAVKLLLIFAFIILISSLIRTDKSSAAAIDLPCKQVEMIFARGSGQSINDGQSDAFRFFSQVKERLAGIPVNTYELGTEDFNGAHYLAVPISGWGFLNLIGATFPTGDVSMYGTSVAGGVKELKGYLTQRYNKCKSTGTWYVLGGYSQGAQVVGQALTQTEDISREIRDKIAYVGLFGDPKLSFPEGIGGEKSSACHGGTLSKWRRGIITNCGLSSGSLMARHPYLKTDMEEKVGLWCNGNDNICDPASSTNTDSHSQYKIEGGPIDAAAQEAAAKLKLIFAGSNIPGEIDISLSHGTKTTGKDTVFVIDTTGSMQNIIEQTKSFVQAAADKIKADNGRVALVAYRDKDDEYEAKVVSHLDDDYATFQSGLNSLTANGGGDTPEATLHALTFAMDNLKWKNGAIKSAIVITDAAFHNSDPIDGSTIRTVAKKSLAIDPVNIYPVVPERLAINYGELASLTAGRVIVDTGDTSKALSAVFDEIQNRPIALLKNSDYFVEKGQELTLDASDSYSTDSRITRYSWDTNGDGIFEAITSDPVLRITMPDEYSGVVQVRVNADNGTFANTSAKLTVRAPSVPPAPPTAPTNLTYTIDSTTDNRSIVTVKWDNRPSVDQWYITVNDMPIGHIESSRSMLQLTDVDRTDNMTVGVAAYSTIAGAGAFSTTTIPPQQSLPIVSTCTQSNIIIRILCKTVAFLKKIINGTVYYFLPYSL